jgi:hypothetical protein
VQAEGEHQEQDDAEPVVREPGGRHIDRRRQPTDARAAAGRERHPDDHEHPGDRDRRQRQGDRRAELLADDRRDRPELLVRHPEVADDQAAEVVEVLHDLGPVESELGDDRRELLGGAHLRLPRADVQDDGGPVAGEQQLGDERHRRRAPEHDDSGARSPGDLPGERASAGGDRGVTR